MSNTPTKAVHVRTLEEKFTGKKPDVSHFKVFGCIPYVHVPNELRTKLDPKAGKYVFIGYLFEQKGYKCYNPFTRQVRLSKVVLDEMATWYADVKDDSGVDVKKSVAEKNSDVQSQGLSKPQESTASSHVANWWSGRLQEKVSPASSINVFRKGKEKVDEGMRMPKDHHFLAMDLSGTENNEANTTGFILAQHNHPEFLELQNSENSQEGHSLLNAYFGQEGSPMEAVQVGGSMQTCTLLNGVYEGPGVKDVTGSISVSSSVCLRGPSELHDTEGAAKDLSAFLGSSYSTVFSDSLGSIVHDIKSPQQLTTATWHRQTPVHFQNFQNYLFKDMDTPKELLPHGTLRVVRPPSEGRGKSHMLPRYWPRMTEKELQLLSTQDANSKVIPLFEKVLSASDAGKVGRLVLPKACAEAYFPPISQPEGVPLIVQDSTGKEWVFQFRFWPNNNSRMYVLEGITPCIQAMNLQAGDTVIFSRLDPQGKLVMGCRRAPNIASAEDNQKPMTANSMAPACMRVVSTGVTEKVSMVPSLTRLLMQTEESSVRVQGNKKLGPFNVRVADNGYKLYSIEKLGSMCQDESFYEHVVCEKRKAKDVVTKAKRQQVEAEKIEFRKNWEAAQNLLQSPPNVDPTIVTIEGYDFEEYESFKLNKVGCLAASPFAYVRLVRCRLVVQLEILIGKYTLVTLLAACIV
ncbi:hypothetical protein L7F22_007670 [Adiantum nelumboides]|nr:hypothetical protein [Adiantum nelumboides]